MYIYIHVYVYIYIYIYIYMYYIYIKLEIYTKSHVASWGIRNYAKDFKQLFQMCLMNN